MNTDTTLILAGNGYELTIAPEAEARKAELLIAAKSIFHVRDNDESADAQYHSRSLAAMRIAVEKSRKQIKEPVNRIGKLIDSTAANFIESLEAEEKRINKLVGNHAAEVARLKAEKEREERQAFEAARAAREAAEIAAAAAADTGEISDVLAAKQAIHERTETLAARFAASEAVAETNVAKGVRFAWDFEVISIELLAKTHRELVTIEPRRAEILALVKNTDEGFPGLSIEASFLDIGLRIFKKPVVSSR